MATQMIARASDVRIQEIDLFQYITSNSTTLPGIVVVSNQGTVKPKRFSSAEAFVAEYGQPNPSISHTIQSALNYFTEGQDLWAIRAVSDDGTPRMAGLILSTTTDDGGVTEAYLNGVDDGVRDPEKFNIEGADFDGGDAIALITPKRGPGSYANDIEFSIAKYDAPLTALSLSYTATGGSAETPRFEVDTRAHYAVTVLTKNGETRPVLNYITVTNAFGADSINLNWEPSANAIGYRIYRVLDSSSSPDSTDYALLASVGPNKTEFKDRNALEPDSTRRYPGAGSEEPPPDSGEYVVTVTQWHPDEEEIVATETFIVTFEPKVDGSGMQLLIDEQINLYSKLVNIKLYSNEYGQDNGLQREFLAGGTSGTAPTSFDVAEAYEQFMNRELYKVNLLINGGIADPITQSAMVSVAERRGDCVALLDVPPAFQEWDKAIDYRQVVLNKNSTYAALFNPDLLQADTVNNITLYVPPSGWIAALCARTDRIAHQAYSIAGLNRGMLNGVLKQRHVFDDGQASALFQARVNYFRTIAGLGLSLWEQQTLSGQNSALQWLSVRRIVNVIKLALYDYLLYSLQEMNSDQIKRAISNTIGAYLKTLKDAQAISDGIVDMSGNTAQTFNAGILVVRVILIPMIPIHEIQLEVVISKAGVSFNEVVNSLNGG